MVINGIAISNEVQFRSKSLVCYQNFHKIGKNQQNGTSASIVEFRMSEKFRKNAQKLRERAKYTGEITSGAKKRLTKAISLLVQSSAEKWIYNPVTKKTQNHKISFITLTLPDIEAAKDAKFTHKNLLQPMLRILRNKYKMCSYVWKAELQENESIHYHITTELFMPWEQLRQHWNALLRKNGFLEKFQQKYGHDNPNSVDIHAVSKVNDLEAYLVKYISKEYQNSKKLSGKVWDCSKNLKEAKYFTTTLDYQLHRQILREIDLGWLTPIYRDRCVILKSKTTDYYQSFSKSVINKYYSHITKIPKWEKQSKSRTQSTIKSSMTELSTTTTRVGATSGKRAESLSRTWNGLQTELKVDLYGRLRCNE